MSPECKRDCETFNMVYDEKVKQLTSRAIDKIVDEFAKQIARSIANENYSLAEDRFAFLEYLIKGLACVSEGWGFLFSELKLRDLPTLTRAIKTITDFYEDA